MSKELEGIIPEFDKETTGTEDAFIIMSLQSTWSGGSDLFSGSLVGFSNEEGILKIDMSMSISNAYMILSKSSNADMLCQSCFLTYVQDITRINGPFSFKNIRIFDFNRDTKMCTLGIDLTRV